MSSGDNRRVARVEKEVQQTIAQFLISGVKGPMPGLVTVTKVIMPADLRAAKVYISVLGSEEDREVVMETLKDQAPQAQKFIGDQLRMRYCPKLTFFKDDTTDQVMKINRILHDLETERKKNEEEP